MIRKTAMLVLVLFLCSPAAADDLRKLGLDDAAALGTTIESDDREKVEGKSSVKVTTRSPTTVCLGEIGALDVENARLVYRARVKSDLDGAAYLEMWVRVGGGRYFSRGTNDPVTGKSGWRTIRTPFVFQRGQSPEAVTLNLVVNGRGTVWVDDVVLSRAPLN